VPRRSSSSPVRKRSPRSLYEAVQNVAVKIRRPALSLGFDVVAMNLSANSETVGTPRSLDF
jgi:hypothetical protein